MSSEPLPPLLSIEQVARLLRVPYWDASRAVHSGEIRSLFIDGRVLVPTFDLLVEFGVPRAEARARVRRFGDTSPAA